MNSEDALPISCPACGGSGAIFLGPQGVYWLFECVTCGKVISLQVRETAEERATRLATDPPAAGPSRPQPPANG